MRRILVAILGISILLTACAPESPELAQGGEITLGGGEHVLIAGIEITFVEVVQDSRCPSDVQCVWAGQVQVSVDIADAGQPKRFTLTQGEMLEGDVDVIEESGVHLSLLEVEPYPKDPEGIGERDYVITLEYRRMQD